MDITCWNCKTVTKLDQAAVEAAIGAMDSANLGLHDISCSSCGKANRTTRDTFVAGLQTLQATASSGKAEKKVSEEKVKHEEKKAAKEFVKKSKKGK